MRKTYTKRDLGRSFCLILAVMLSAQVLLSVLFGQARDQDGSLPDWAYWTMQALYCICIGLTSFAYAKATKTDFLHATTADKPPVLTHVIWGVAMDIGLIAAMCPLNSWIMQLLQKLTGNVYSVNMPMQFVPMMIVACLLPAIAEEFAFRGTLAQSLKDGKNRIGTLAVSGALFALIHFNPAQTLHQFVLGAVLTLLAFRSGSIWTAVAVHFFNNAAAVALSFVLPDESAIRPYFVWIFAAGLILFVLCAAGYLKTAGSVWLPQSKDSCFAEANAESERNDAAGRAALILSLAIGAAVWIATLVTPQ